MLIMLNWIENLLISLGVWDDYSQRNGGG